MPKKPTKKTSPCALTELPALGLASKDVINGIRQHYSYTLGRDLPCDAPHYLYTALALTLRDRLMERWRNSKDAYRDASGRRAYYLSMEFLIGRSLGNAMLNLGMTGEVSKALYDMGLKLEDLVSEEQDAGLGNGGLGRLAACFMDSCATLQLPVMGYGLRYEYGMFRQSIDNGFQVENPDHWLRNGHPWELERPELTARIRFGGRTEIFRSRDGRDRVRWLDSNDVLAVPFDVPVPGYKNGTVNTLRLWKAAATDEFDLDEFNAGDYAESVASQNAAENITMVLYPNDANENGKELRLRQQYFLASASLQDVLRRWKSRYGKDFTEFAALNCFQLNDTHPSIAVAELMRLLVDENDLLWNDAWEITRNCMAYTNHTLLPEALERWSVPLFRQLLPRLLEIIFEINARFLGRVATHWPGETERLTRMSIIEEGPVQQVRMAYLAIVGSFSVNGVAELHSNLLKQGLFRDFYELWPEKFNNKTNGITPRRWLAWCNPGLSGLIDSAIGEDWRTDLSQLSRLKPLADDAAFRERWQAVRLANKEQMIAFKSELINLHMGPDALFDVQVKRIHEYKRQLLNILHVIHLYDRLKHGDSADITPRCVLIGGKAAPGYAMAKQIIKLINNVAQMVNVDPLSHGRLQVAFLPNYRVSAMEIICPAADLSEQISTAGKEASGTGNMKFMLNGAVTIGTLDGANIEIREEVGEDNFFLFGLTAEEVETTRPHYNPEAIIAADEDLSRVMRLLECGYFNQFEPGIFDGIIASIKNPHDPWMTAADFRSYLDAQHRAAVAFRDQDAWTRMSILNCAASGRFSSDRTIGEYNQDIWRLTPIVPKAVG
ncbi:MAG: glycogen/starch/alpha-glucan phosphorylase [Methylococcaceae bacterium]|nr:MAG: glycogen/starch/alpha-glucan phosphorylase [Methylococcaceae bacterium]